MSDRELTPLAIAELDTLLADILSGDLERIRTWCTRNAARARKRERHVLRGLTAIVAGVFDQGPDRLYAFEIREDQTSWQVMCNRLSTAMLNRDLETVEALVDAWSLWDAADRAEVLRGFAWRLYDESSEERQGLDNEKRP